MLQNDYLVSTLLLTSTDILVDILLPRLGGEPLHFMICQSERPPRPSFSYATSTDVFPHADRALWGPCPALHCISCDFFSPFDTCPPSIAKK